MRKPDAKAGPTPATTWLLLALQVPKIGSAAARRLGMELWDQRDDALTAIGLQRASVLREHDPRLALEAASRIMDECARLSIHIISLADEEYPHRLREIRDCPPIIYVRGDVSSLNMRGCAVVGTRQSSDTGECIAKRIAAQIAKMNAVTVSGLALGIDAAAHTGALAANGITIAILAHGLHTVSPATNRKIAEQLLASGGALLSEHEPGTPPRPAEFVRRNRIQSGMSYCSIVVESGAVGGSIHQARFTREQGRPIFAVLPDLKAVPHRRFNSEGGEFLVREMGAIPLRTTDELGKYLEDLFQAGAGEATVRSSLGL